MFAPFCPQHHSRVLLSLADIESLHHTDRGIEVHYRCLCGHRGMWSASSPLGLAAPERPWFQVSSRRGAQLD